MNLPLTCGKSKTAQVQKKARKPLQWFRFYYEFSVDPRIQMLSEPDQRRFVMLLCVHATYPTSRLSDADVAWRLRIEVDQWIDTKTRLVERGLVNVVNKPTYEGVGGAILRPSGPEWELIRSRIFARDDYTCRYCGERGKRLECDHVVPVTRGGDSSDDNLVTSCVACNRAKRDKVISIEAWSATRRSSS